MRVFVVFGLCKLIYGIVVNLALACSCLCPMLNLVCYVWLYYNWFFVFNCICAVLRGSLYVVADCQLLNKRITIIIILLTNKQT